MKSSWPCCTYWQKGLRWPCPIITSPEMLLLHDTSDYRCSNHHQTISAHASKSQERSKSVAILHTHVVTHIFWRNCSQNLVPSHLQTTIILCNQSEELSMKKITSDTAIEFRTIAGIDRKLNYGI